MALTVGLAIWSLAAAASAGEPVSLENVVDPGPNSADEPMAAEFSMERAVHFLDSAALTWQKEQQCFTCHTNFAYLYARPFASTDETAHRQVRSYAEELVRDRWPAQGPRWDAEVVATAAALAFNDRATTGKLHPLTRTALDRMWELQQEHGGWNWLKCDWPPMESDDHYGVTLAAIAIGAAPEGYSETPAAKQGLVGIRRYLKDNPPPTLHHRAMLLWATSYFSDLQTKEEQAATVAELLSLQKADGGWGLATLGDWKRADESAQDLESSDGYGTGFVMFVLRQSGMPGSAEPLARGVRWLKTHQRQSGRWFTRSVHEDGTHYITHAGTAMAVMALSAC
jgi:squalene-hopene/tetraprenyl-beta-curcumene cyclase